MKTAKPPYPLRLFPLLLILFSFPACEKYASGPDIEWVQGWSMHYSYSGGVMSGVTLYKGIRVTGNKSGEIKITASIDGSTKSCVMFVEEGHQYKVSVGCSLGKKGGSSTITLDSPTVIEPFKMKISDYSLILKGVSII
ncbi:MAG: hypothetical protein R6U86_07980 [Bacteroidales bacterium]